MVNEKQCSEKVSEESCFCEQHIKAKDKWYAYKVNINLINVRKHALVNDKDLKEDELWQKEIPYDTRQLILKDLVAGYKAAVTNKARGNIDDYVMQYKSKKRQLSQIFHIDKRALTKTPEGELILFKTRGVGVLRTRNKMRNWVKRHVTGIEADCKIIKYKSGEYYLLLPMTQEIVIKTKPFDFVALDSGTRTFQTIYSPNGICGKIGDEFANKYLMKTAERIDQLNSIAANADNCKTKLHIRKRQALLRTKIKNQVADLHWQTINFLCNNFKTIVVTPFKVSEMVNSTTRNINDRAVRQMLALSHYAFKERLYSRAARNGNQIILTSEAYTTKTCGRCGNVKQDMGGEKVYNCDKCGLVIDRDLGSARSITIRLLSS